MSKKCLIAVALVVALSAPACVFAEIVTPFRGSLDLKEKKLNLLLNPDEEKSLAISGHFAFKGNRLYLDPLAFGGVNLKGFVELLDPYRLNMAVDLSNIPMQDFLTFLGADDFPSEGSVSGQIQASGAIDHLRLKGNLVSYDGSLNKVLRYDSIVLNIQGTYPVVHLEDSTVAQSDGVVFKLEGDFDLSEEESFREKLAALTKKPMVSSDDSGSEWIIRRTKTESGTSDLKYMIRTGDGIRDEGSDLMGVQQSIQF